MLATGASPWYRVFYSIEAQRADSFACDMRFDTIRSTCANSHRWGVYESPLSGALLLIGAFFHGLAPVANMNTAWDRASSPAARQQRGQDYFIYLWHIMLRVFFASLTHVKWRYDYRKRF